MKDFNAVGEKMAGMVIKWPCMTHKFSVLFLTKLQKTGSKRYVIYVKAFDPIKILISWALQNDRQNLSFVKDIKVLGKEMTEMFVKMANS